MNKLFLLVLCAICTNYLVMASEKVVVCYYGTWATYRYGLGKFDVGHINTDLCTHIIYTFVGITSQGVVTSLDPYLDLPDNWGRNNFGKFVALKQQNQELKVLLAVGGWNEASAKYSVMAASSTLRKNFVTSAVEMLQKYGFDGLDIDWEYPNRRDTVNGQADVNNFTQLLKELRVEFDKYGFILTAAVASVKSAASLSYDIPSIVQYLDLVNVMTYDMYGAWDPQTGHNAPLYRGEGDENVDKDQLNTVDVALDYWLSQGCPPEKLLLGIPLYGHTFQLANANSNGVRAAAVGPGIAGPYTATSGTIGYNELCSKLRTESWEKRYDSLAKVPYAVQGQNWVSYDDADSIVTKIEYALKLNLGGAMVWSVETDDFHGICHTEDFPLLRAINRALGRSGSATITTTTPSTSDTPTTTLSTASGSTTTPVPSTTTPVPSTTTPVPSTTTPVSSTTTPVPSTTEITTPSLSTTSVSPTVEDTTTTSTATSSTTGSTVNTSVCKQAGPNPNPNDCSSFYVCIQNNYNQLEPILFQCPGNLNWDQENQICNYPNLVKCEIN